MDESNHDIYMKVGTLEGRIGAVEKTLSNVPTKQEVYDIKKLLELQNGEIKKFNDYLSRWKGAAVVFLALGALFSMMVKFFAFKFGLYPDNM